MADRISHETMALELEKLVYGKSDWLSRFASGKQKRSDHEIELKRNEMAVLRQAAADYRAAAVRAA